MYYAYVCIHVHVHMYMYIYTHPTIDLHDTNKVVWVEVSLEYKDTATHCNTLQHTATHCNTLQHTLL